MFIAELALPDFASYDLSTLRTGIMAGSPCPVEVMKRVVSEMHMTEVTICYGMTETSPVSTQTTADDDMERRVSTVGRVHPHVEVKVIDPETGRVLPRGTPGELCTRGYSVMLGYWDEPEQTAEAIDAARWMHTGDLAVMDEAGYLNIVGRIKDMVIRGGENVYPREVEEFLYAHPAIEDVQVIGVPDAEVRRGALRLGQAAARPGARRRRVREYCQGKIAHYKIPRYVRFTSRLPDDDHRQGAEVQDAGDRSRTGTGNREPDQDRLTCRCGRTAGQAGAIGLRSRAPTPCCRPGPSRRPGRSSGWRRCPAGSCPRRPWPSPGWCGR